MRRHPFTAYEVAPCFLVAHMISWFKVSWRGLLGGQKPSKWLILTLYISNIYHFDIKIEAFLSGFCLGTKDHLLTLFLPYPALASHMQQTPFVHR